MDLIKSLVSSMDQIESLASGLNLSYVKVNKILLLSVACSTEYAHINTKYPLPLFMDILKSIHWYSWTFR